jgi:hypothetical protein
MTIVMLWALFAIFSAILAKSKNRSAFGWGAVGLFCGPFGLLVAALPALPDPLMQMAEQAQMTRQAQMVQQAQITQQVQTRSCPDCREPIRYDARVCRHCGLRYPYLQEPARSQVAIIAELHRQGRSEFEIIAELDGHGVSPTVGATWTTETIAAIIRDHVL